MRGIPTSLAASVEGFAQRTIGPEILPKVRHGDVDQTS
jgi:hypothetical protein